MSAEKNLCNTYRFYSNYLDHPYLSHLKILSNLWWFLTCWFYWIVEKPRENISSKLIFVHYEKIDLLRLADAEKIFVGKKCTDCNGKLVLLHHDADLIWQTNLVGMPRFCTCIQFFCWSDLSSCERKIKDGMNRVIYSFHQLIFGNC